MSCTCKVLGQLLAGRHPPLAGSAVRHPSTTTQRGRHPHFPLIRVLINSQLALHSHPLVSLCLALVDLKQPPYTQHKSAG